MAELNITVTYFIKHFLGNEEIIIDSAPWTRKIIIDSALNIAQKYELNHKKFLNIWMNLYNTCHGNQFIKNSGSNYSTSIHNYNHMHEN